MCGVHVCVLVRVCTLVFRGTQGICLSPTNLVKMIAAENDQTYNEMLPRVGSVNTVVILVGGTGGRSDVETRGLGLTRNMGRARGKTSPLHHTMLFAVLLPHFQFASTAAPSVWGRGLPHCLILIDSGKKEESKMFSPQLKQLKFRELKELF